MAVGLSRDVKKSSPASLVVQQAKAWSEKSKEEKEAFCKKASVGKALGALGWGCWAWWPAFAFTCLPLPLRAFASTCSSQLTLRWR